MTITVQELAKIAQAEIMGNPQVQVAAVGLDSTTLPQGALFAGVPGSRAHGAQFVPEHAAAVLTDRAGQEMLDAKSYSGTVLVVEDVRAVLGEVAAAVYGHPSEQLQIIGITGTSGKTTTSYLVEKGLMAAGKKVGLIGTTGTRIQGRTVPTKLTTPEATTLQELFARMVDEGVTHVVMEVSSHALELGRVAGTRFTTAGFSNLSQDHLDFHPTMQDYFHAKAALFDPERSPYAQNTVVMLDDEWGQAMADIAGASVIRVATNAAAQDAADIRAVDVRSLEDGTQEFLIAGVAAQPIQVRLQLPGAFNIANASLAIALASTLQDVDMEAFIAGIAQAQVPGRMERIDCGQDFLAVVDYAHKPAAVAAVLDTVRAQVEGRIAVVLGAGGDRDSSKRAIMGECAAQRADLVVVTDDNPRTEEPASIRQAVIAGARAAVLGEQHSPEIVEIGDRREAIQYAIAWAQPGDCVVVAGKGHEVGQLIGDTLHHFDDREEVRLALEEQGARA